MGEKIGPVLPPAGSGGGGGSGTVESVTNSDGTIVVSNTPTVNPVVSRAAITGVVTIAAGSNVSATTTLAPLASPALTGVPTAPTATVGTNTTQIATTAFVLANAGSGSVTSVSVASSNGFAGTSSGGATPALTLSTTVTGVLKGNGTAISAAVAGTDYSAGTSALATGILKSTTTTGALTIAVAGDFPTLNQNTTGTAANLSGTPALPNGTTATTQSPGDTSTDLATDAFVAAAIIAAPQSAQYTTSTITANPAPGVVGTYYRANYSASGSFTLPTSPATGSWIKVKQIANNTLTFVGTVDGSTSFALSLNQAIELIYNGTSWDAN